MSEVSDDMVALQKDLLALEGLPPAERPTVSFNIEELQRRQQKSAQLGALADLAKLVMERLQQPHLDSTGNNDDDTVSLRLASEGLLQETPRAFTGLRRTATSPGLLQETPRTFTGLRRTASSPRVLSPPTQETSIPRALSQPAVVMPHSISDNVDDAACARLTAETLLREAYRRSVPNSSIPHTSQLLASSPSPKTPSPVSQKHSLTPEHPNDAATGVAVDSPSDPTGDMSLLSLSLLGSTSDSDDEYHDCNTCAETTDEGSPISI